MKSNTVETGNIRIDTQGNLLGETAVLPNSIATATVRAVTEVHVIEVNVELLISIFQTEPGISKRYVIVALLFMGILYLLFMVAQSHDNVVDFIVRLLETWLQN
jgi:CRP-like cAMP-binding protein